MAEKPKKYKCCFCDIAFSRSEHRSRHERSHTKERPFHCPKCPSKFVRRDLLLRHDRTVHARSNGRRASASPPSESTTSSTTTAKGKAARKQQEQQKQSILTAGDDKLSTLVKAASGDDFNAALLMTELHQSFHKGSASSTAAINTPPNKFPFSQTTRPANAVPPSITLSLQPPTTTTSLPPLSVATSTDAPSQSYSSENARYANRMADTARSFDPPKVEVFRFEGRPSVLQEYSKESNQVIPRTSFYSTNTARASFDSNASHQGPSQLDDHKPKDILPQHNVSNPGSIFSITGNQSFMTHQQRQPYRQIRIPQIPDMFSVQTLTKYFDEVSAKSLTYSPPTKLQFNRYLATYFTAFHPHLPFLHAPTFDPTIVAPCLLCSVCSVGALLCHENNTATALHQSSKMLINSMTDINKDMPSQPPIWTTQALIINLIYSSWSGDPRGFDHLAAVRTLLAGLVTRELGAVHPRDQPISWMQWLSDETIRRTYFAAYIVFGSLAAIFNYPSPLEADDEITLNSLLPCSEVMWNSIYASESEWTNAYYKESVSSFREGVRKVETRNPRLQLAPFAWRILSIRLLLQARRSGTEEASSILGMVDNWFTNAKDAESGQGTNFGHMMFHSSLFSIASSILPPGYTSYSLPRDSDLSIRIRELQNPLVVDASVLNLVTEIRLTLDLSAIKDVIRYHVPHEISNASLNTLGILHSTGKLSSLQVTSLVQRCFDVIRIPCLLGTRLLKSMMGSPLITSSIESLLCCFEICLVVVFWCYHIEGMGTPIGSPSSSSPEQRLYQSVEVLCAEAGMERVQGRLSPTLALLGADILEGVECWGLANVLSLSLRSLAYNLFPDRRNGFQAPGQPAQQQMPYPALLPTPNHTATSQQFPLPHHPISSQEPGHPGYGTTSRGDTTPTTFGQLAPLSSLRTTAAFKDLKAEREMYLPLRTV